MTLEKLLVVGGREGIVFYLIEVGALETAEVICDTVAVEEAFWGFQGDGVEVREHHSSPPSSFGKPPFTQMMISAPSGGAPHSEQW